MAVTIPSPARGRLPVPMTLDLGDIARPGARAALRLRRWDDAAKVGGLRTPPLAHFLAVAARAALPPDSRRPG